jgi:Cd2+/Zn2+-exporting ATPase
MNKNQLSLNIQNLGCAGCAAKMETAMKKLPEIEQAVLDFGSGRLFLELNPDADQSRIIPTVESIIRSIESDACLITDKKSSEEDNKSEIPTFRSAWRASFPRRTFIRFIIGLVPFLLALTISLPDIAEITLFVAAWLILGYDVLYKAVGKIGSKHIFDENFLMGLATAGALLIGEYPEAVAVMLFYQAGEIFQDMAVTHSRSSIKALTNLRPDYANLLISSDESEFERVGPEQVKIRDRLLIRPGERIPVDCVILSGSSDLDTSALTGESMPVSVEPDQEIMAGSINGSGLLVAEVLREYSDSAIARVLAMAENASARKSQAEQFITRFAAFYTPIMVVLALLIAVLPPLVLEQSFKIWIYRALILLVISCPCALVLSVPMSYFAGLGAASSRGLLIKGGQYLEKLSQVNQIVFDKTGTLTEGEFSVDQVKSLSEISETELLLMAAKLEGPSDHPIARSIRQAAEKKKTETEVQNSFILYSDNNWQAYHERPGFGIEASLDGHNLMLGNEKLIRKSGLSVPEQAAENTGSQRVWLIIDSVLAGYIDLTDKIRQGTIEMIAELRNQGIEKTAMLSGDRQQAAEKIGKLLEIDEIHAELLPDNKVDQLEQLMRRSYEVNQKSVTAFVGDGINDAPVLARSDLGIAVGSASDAAVESADLVIIGYEPAKINQAISLAKRTAVIVRQNVALTLGLKLVVMLLAVAGLGGIWQAVFADVGVALLAVLNAMRILRHNP